VTIQTYKSQFGRRLSLLNKNPALYRIHNWFINQHSREHINKRISLEGLPSGNWIICGYGRFGKAVHQFIYEANNRITVVDIDPQTKGAPENSIKGRGTEANTLIEANN